MVEVRLFTAGNENLQISKRKRWNDPWGNRRSGDVKMNSHLAYYRYRCPALRVFADRYNTRARV